MNSAPSPSPDRRRRGLLLLAITVSLIANLAFLAALQPPPQPVAAIDLEPPVASPPAIPEPDLWTRLQHDDPATLVERLQTAGFDETTVRAIVWSRLQAVTPSIFEPVHRAPYWRQRGALWELNQRHTADRRRGFVAPDRAAYHALFGEDPPSLRLEPDSSSVREALRHTPPRVAQVLRELREARSVAQPSDIVERSISGQPDAATAAYRAQRDQAQAAYEAGLRNQLSEAEYAAYLLYESPTAYFLRNNVNGLNLTQTEFDQIVTIMADQQSLLVRRDLPKYAEELTAALGPDRYAELAQAVVGNEQANMIVGRLDLPFTTAVTLQSIQDDILARERTISRDRSLSSDAKTAQQASLAAEARTRLAAALPTEGYELYLTYAASWMNSLLQAEARLQPGG